jgi:hypothetical protein
MGGTLQVLTRSVAPMELDDPTAGARGLHSLCNARPFHPRGRHRGVHAFRAYGDALAAGYPALRRFCIHERHEEDANAPCAPDIVEMIGKE